MLMTAHGFPGEADPSRQEADVLHILSEHPDDPLQLALSDWDEKGSESLDCSR